MVWAAIGSVVSAIAPAVAGAAVSSFLAPDGSSGGGGGGGGGGAPGMADPFASQRPQYQEQLKTLMSGTFSPTDPSYQWRFDQGMEGVNRTMASTGMLNSGRQFTALTDYGQGLASTEYANQYQRLATLSGATIGSPATAGQIQYGQNQANQQSASALGNTIGGFITDGIGNLFSGGSGGGSGAAPVDMTGFRTPSLFSGGGGSGGGGYDPFSTPPLAPSWLS